MTTTSVSAATTSSAAATALTTIGQSLLTGLNAGSGVDTAALVTSLVTAQFAAKNASLTAQDTALTAQISSVSKISSGITSFNSALKSLVTGGTLTTQPTSTDSSVLTASALPGAKISGLASSIQVTRLATAQVATSASFTSRSAVVAGTAAGTLTLTLGSATVTGSSMTAFTATPSTATPPVDTAVKIAIPANATLDQVASAINAAAAGVTASIVTDADGTARLTLKGATGTKQAFTLDGGSDPGLQKLNVGVGQSATTIGSAALNAKLTVDGVAVERPSNTVKDLIDGVQLNLTGVSATGKSVTLGSTTPSDAIIQAVNDFVTTYNAFLSDLKTETDPATGPLRSDYNATGLTKALRGLTLTPLTTGGAAGDPTTLAAIGVSTNKDGTLSVDSAKLTAALVKTPGAVEAMFASGTGASGGGIGAALDAITTTAVDKSVTVNGQIEHLGLVGSTTLYTNAKNKVSEAEDKVTTDTAAYQERLTKQYAASDAIVAAYKASQTQLQNQIDQWNKTSS